MIISRLLGGAGNQLFQYTAGRALADHLGCDLALDSRYIAGSEDRGNCFAHFSGARITPVSALPPAKHDGFLRYGLWRKFGKDPKFCREQELGFNPEFFDLGDKSYLHGYWQSPRYFGDSAEAFRKDLQFTTQLDTANVAMAEQIKAAKIPVSVHVRRGDYMASGSFQACTEEYYVAALAALSKMLGKDLTCFVFSNDPVWAAENMNLGFERVIVDLNDETRGHFDMQLMSLCAHHVIANSTFSWWGAWLNPDPDKLVAAPKNWFSKEKLSNPDICPDNWIRI
ncbi:alpha-1,2-fucosyltransferase [Roseovarius sp. EL26]|uniref:alpha-1,2-fucosyltransferase n=1 Tax=Roseovarius sp. EL26 TaxID=2126672 RepID=UPI000EA33C8D|nr:alpha-1,2-fucosyltransferase [Roseovarius sp. EL26]